MEVKYMDRNFCKNCQKNNITGDRILIIVSFAHVFQAKAVMGKIARMHIIPAWIEVFSKEQVKGIALFNEFPTLIIELHGIKDIMQLQALFIESVCRENGALTVDIIAAGKSQEKILTALC